MPWGPRSHRSRVARRARVALVIGALFAVVFALIGNQPSYGDRRRARPSRTHASVVHRAVNPNGLEAAVDPAEGIINQVVKVSWSGFHETSFLGDWGVILYQCKENPVSLDDCFTVAPYPNSAGGNAILDGVTNHDGTGFAFFEVRNSSKLPELNCSNTVPCSILVWENDGNAPPTNSLPPTSIVVPISFARSSADCPVPNHLDVRAEGEASAASLFYNWVGQLCQGDPKLALDYTATSSNNGRENELAGDTDIGVTSLGATKAELATSATKTDYAYAPLDLNAVVVAFNIDDPNTGQQITDVTLTPRLIARLVTDSQLLDFFNDPEFQELNPGHTWPTGGASQPLLRAERNADTRLITSWMIQDKDAKDFIAGNDKHGVFITPDFLNKAYPVDNFEKAASDDGFSPLTGEGQIALHAFYGVKPIDATPTRPSVQGFFAIMDRSTAKQFALPTANLVNHAGTAVAADDTGVMAGYNAMTTLDGVKIANFTSTESTQYPLAKIDYAMVRKNVTKADPSGKVVPDPTKLASIKTFLTYQAGAGQAHLLGGYIPLPAAEVNEAKKVATAMGGPVEKPTPSTTAPTTPITTPTTFTTCCSTDPGSYDSTDYGTTDTVPAGEPLPAPGKRTPTTAPKQRLVAAQAPNWTLASSGGDTTPSPLWLIMILGVAALAARIVLYTSPKVVARVRARREGTEAP